MRKSLLGRFRIWDLGTDQYSHNDLSYNWDKIDEIIGGPDGGPGQSSATQYPTGVESQWIGGASKPYGWSDTERVPGGGYGNYPEQKSGKSLYNVISGLNFNDVPLGTIVAWWRPVADLQPPNGWVVCDGSQVSDHSYSFEQPIIVPDLRNKTVVGAKNTQGANAITDYGNIAGGQAEPQDGFNYAPGVGYDSGKETAVGTAKSGTNVIRDITHHHGAGSALLIPSHSHAMPHVHSITNHKHILNPHQHGMSHQHLIPNHSHYGTASDPVDMATPDNKYNKKAKLGTGTTGNVLVADDNHIHNIRKIDTSGGRAPLKDGAGNNAPPATALQGNSPDYYPYGGQPPVITGLGYGFYAFTSNSIRLASNQGTLAYDHLDTRILTDMNTPNEWDAGRELSYTNYMVSATNPLVATVDTGPAATQITTTNTSQNQVTGETENWPAFADTTTTAHHLNPRMDYVGLLYIIKVKVSTNII